MVRPGYAAVVAGALVAIYAFVMFCARPVPDRIVALFGGPTGVDRVGGLRVDYQPRDGSIRRLEFPRVAEDMVAEVTDGLVRGGFVMKRALETDHAREIAR